ncbi:MAG: hypothetical protein AAFV07_11725, partial [Bacteroidota bacterium]
MNPAGTAIHPFLPPSLIHAYQARIKLPYLILTEGQFKAAKGDLHGLHIAGLTGIHGFREQKVRLRESLLQIIQACEVEHLILLHDGDCRDIKWDPEQSDKDLTKRLWSFANSVMSFRAATLPLGIKASFAHIHESHQA